MGGKEDHRVFLGMGSNLGDRRENLLSALRMLDAMEGVRILEVSSVYETAPWGMLEQPDFLNLVALVSTSRDPRGMLAACRDVEEELGRVRAERWGPRSIDVDILIFDDLQLEEEDLVIPHPRMLEREFVMVPLLELQPGYTPVGKETEARLSDAAGRERVRMAFRYDKEEWHG
ncbi:MAG: 2-amino-4-hydroxy-6-hydroxymethyldihydropteridine diphosphokinase [Actinobacteria bacterium]|jgi:2-amino-4-hydroxy-6-hydroxymethyldihydropteridine diphosphokinase|nr:MAG: 2-amino-4-hydroxy-6-hydroxymethyldihydropteridine diphosphokinase [Actinomycetota bacterium]